MHNKVTKLKVRYPEGWEPTLVVPQVYQPHRFVIGRPGENTLLVVAMNPSRAADDFSDRTVNKIIKTAGSLGYDGWMVMNTYPERSTDAGNLGPFSPELIEQNIAHLKDIVAAHNITEVWGAWGDPKHDNLRLGATAIRNALDELAVKIFYFGNITLLGNPRHPLYLKIDGNDKKYL